MKDKKEKKHPELNHGRQHHQKMKPYLVMQYLLENSDEQHPKKADDIVAELDKKGIYAERRSIYRDIEEINKAIIMLEQGCNITESADILENDKYDNDKLLLYNKSKKGFYARPRNYEENDIRLLAECVYSAKFLDKGQTDFLIDIVCRNLNKRQAEKIKHDVLLVDRVRTNNVEGLNSILTINQAMSKEIEGEKHIPEKIRFNYLKYTLNDTKKQVERRHGDSYIASPFALLINDGYYYVLAFDDKKKKFINYRIDRMKNVELFGEKREGEEEFLKIDIKNYTKKVFSMFSGEEKMLTLQFTNNLLDTAIDRFGTKDVSYSKNDDRHFTVITKLEVSNQFFGWLLGFGKQVKILEPQSVKDKFTEYIDNIRKMY